MEDVRYVWKVPDPVQFAPNLFLPGGFDLADHQGGYCDVQTATGESSTEKAYIKFIRSLLQLVQDKIVFMLRVVQSSKIQLPWNESS